MLIYWAINIETHVILNMIVIPDTGSTPSGVGLQTVREKGLLLKENI